MTDRELMQQALDALLKVWHSERNTKHSEAIEALRARLAQPEQEPVAWVAYENGEKHGIDFDEDEIAKLPVGTMLYTTPPQREWQGLTEEEIIAMRHMRDWTAGWTDIRYARAIEAKLKEKNIGH